MGQEQSSSGIGESSSLMFLTQKARGISPKGGRSTVKHVVVVNSGTDDNFDINQDEDFINLQKIPLFYPILRNSLNINGVKDPPDVATKFDGRAFYSICQKFQEHLSMNSELVCTEQTNLGIRIREIDYAIATLSNCLSERQKKYSKLISDLNKVTEVNNQLMKVTSLLQEIVPMAQTVNEMFPEPDRLPPLDLSALAQSTFVPKGTDEQKVIDENNTNLQISPNAA